MQKSRFLLAVFSAVLILGFSGCNHDPEIEHEHTFNKEWKSDGTYHWHEATCGHAEEQSGKAEHTFDEGKVTTNPTCEAKGTKTYTCTVCGFTKTESIPAKVHIFDEGRVTVNPTCEAKGTKTYTCTLCGFTKTESIEATGHSYNHGVITKEPTLTEAGTKTITCNNCGKTENIEVILLKGITITSNPSKTFYKKAENLNLTGLTVVAEYADDTTVTIADFDYVISGFDTSVNTGTNTITVSFTDTETDVTKTAEFTIYIQKEMDVEDFLEELGTTVEVITSNEAVPGISFSSDGKTANIFGIKLEGDFYDDIKFPNSLKEADLRGLDTSTVYSMSGMFYGCSELTNVNLTGFNTSMVENMCLMFYDCRKLTTLDLSSFDTTQVTNMNSMFNECNKIKTLDLSSFNTSQVTEMFSMFSCCKELTTVDLSSFDTSNVENMNSMFDCCESLKTLDLSSFTVGEGVNTGFMFNGCALTLYYNSSKWNIDAENNNLHGTITFVDVNKK